MSARFTKLNVYEVYLWLLRTGSSEERERFALESQSKCVEITTSDVLAAAHMKAMYAKKEFSTVDCIGYAASQRLGLTFLTGDKAFKDMENVEFVV